ncbi:MAG: cell division protein SepF [Oscillospiraceae bacterium]|nr:cell division protein SepF [Oscillospiraceae bacterium]
MKLGDRLKRALCIEDADYYEDGDENEILDDEDDGSAPARERLFARSEKKPVPAQSGSTKVVDIHTTAKLQVVLKKPEHFDEGTAIADELIEKRTVVLNLEATAKDEAGKLLCFLSGVAYANGGKLKKIANNTYIITPYNVDVMGDLLDELENNGMFFV